MTVLRKVQIKSEYMKQMFFLHKFEDFQDEIEKFQEVCQRVLHLTDLRKSLYFIETIYKKRLIFLGIF